MCYYSQTISIDAGTNGLNGQAYPIYPGLSKCYQCQPKQKAKTYQYCTIRALPSEPIHCFIWAKMIFGQLLGIEEESVIVKAGQKWIDEFKDEAFYEVCKVLFLDEIEKYKEAKEGSQEIRVLDEELREDGEFSKIVSEGSGYFMRIFGEENVKEFDKDSADHIRLLTILGNFRAVNFGLE